MATLIDSYSESNVDTYINCDSNNLAGGAQCFNNSFNGVIDSFKFYMKKVGSPTGSVTPKLYSTTGTVGTSAVPNTLLASADSFDVSTLSTTSALITFTFSGANRIPITSGTSYALAFEYNGGNSSNSVLIGYDNSSSSHGGNRAVKNPGWVGAAADQAFYVYGDVLSKGMLLLLNS